MSADSRGAGQPTPTERRATPGIRTHTTAHSRDSNLKFTHQLAN